MHPHENLVIVLAYNDCYYCGSIVVQLWDDYSTTVECLWYICATAATVHVWCIYASFLTVIGICFNVSHIVIVFFLILEKEIS